MSVGWAAIQAQYVPSLELHAMRCQRIGLACPLDVFEQLFHEAHLDGDLAHALAHVDWQRVRWDSKLLSGRELRDVSVPRTFETAFAAGQANVLERGLEDDREQVVRHWRDVGTWLRAPVLVTGDIARLPDPHGLVVGFQRLANLRALMLRNEISENSLHRVWIGRR